MERSLKVSDSVLKPIAIGFVLGFMLVGATRLQPDQPAPVSADITALQSLSRDPALRLPGHASAAMTRPIIHPLF